MSNPIKAQKEMDPQITVTHNRQIERIATRSYSFLSSWAQRKFNILQARWHLVYTDDDNDEISVSSQSDLDLMFDSLSADSYQMKIQAHKKWSSLDTNLQHIPISSSQQDLREPANYYYQEGNKQIEKAQNSQRIQAQNQQFTRQQGYLSSQAYQQLPRELNQIERQVLNQQTEQSQNISTNIQQRIELAVKSRVEAVFRELLPFLIQKVTSAIMGNQQCMKQIRIESFKNDQQSPVRSFEEMDSVAEHYNSLQEVQSFQYISANKSGYKDKALKSPQQNLPVHEGIKCDGCDVYPIRGIRYQCLAEKDFNLCQECQDQGEIKHPAHHQMIKLRVPQVKNASTIRKLEATFSQELQEIRVKSKFQNAENKGLSVQQTQDHQFDSFNFSTVIEPPKTETPEKIQKYSPLKTEQPFNMPFSVPIRDNTLPAGKERQTENNAHKVKQSLPRTNIGSNSIEAQPARSKLTKPQIVARLVRQPVQNIRSYVENNPHMKVTEMKAQIMKPIYQKVDQTLRQLNESGLIDFLSERYT